MFHFQTGTFCTPYGGFYCLWPVVCIHSWWRSFKSHNPPREQLRAACGKTHLLSGKWHEAELLTFWSNGQAVYYSCAHLFLCAQVSVSSNILCHGGHVTASIYLLLNELYEQILIKFSGHVDQVLSHCFFLVLAVLLWKTFLIFLYSLHNPLRCLNFCVINAKEYFSKWIFFFTVIYVNFPL